MADLQDIEKEIDRTRMDMDETIDAISDRMSLRRIGDRTLEALARGPDIPAGTHRFYAERPLIMGGVAFLLGAAVGVLFAPSGARSPVQPGSGHLAEDMAERAREVKDRAVERVEETGQRVARQAEEMKERAQERIRDLSETAQEKSHEIRQRIGRSGAQPEHENVDKVSGWQGVATTAQPTPSGRPDRRHPDRPDDE